MFAWLFKKVHKNNERRARQVALKIEVDIAKNIKQRIQRRSCLQTPARGSAVYRKISARKIQQIEHAAANDSAFMPEFVFGQKNLWYACLILTLYLAVIQGDLKYNKFFFQ